MIRGAFFTFQSGSRPDGSFEIVVAKSDSSPFSHSELAMAMFVHWKDFCQRFKVDPVQVQKYIESQEFLNSGGGPVLSS